MPSEPSIGLSAHASDPNLLWACIALLGVSLLSAGFTAWACGYVLKGFENSNTMALLITDAGIRSDDAKLEHQLSTATQALHSLEDVGLAVCVGGTGVLLVLAFRTFFRPRR